MTTISDTCFHSAGDVETKNEKSMTATLGLVVHAAGKCDVARKVL
jgi:hypothetical protein